jgi:hypothetical protein
MEPELWDPRFYIGYMGEIYDRRKREKGNEGRTKRHKVTQNAK